MANVQQQSLGLDDKQKPDNQQQQQPGPMSTTGAMTPGNVPSQSRVSSYSTGQAQTPGSGRFTNLQSYINANKPAGEQLGQKIASNVGQGLTKTEKEATTQAGQIRQGIESEKARIGEAAGFATQIGEDPTKITNPQPTQLTEQPKLLTGNWSDDYWNHTGIYDPKLRDATSGIVRPSSLTPEEIASMKNSLLKVKRAEQSPLAQPTGPSALERFKQLYSGTSSADQLKAQAGTAEANAINQFGDVGKSIANLGNEQGRFDLLRQTIRQPNYSQGQQNLDQLFLQTANPQALAQQQQNLQSRLGQSQTAAQNAYQGDSGINASFVGDNALGAQATNAKTQLEKALTGATEKFNTEQSTEATNLTNQNTTAQAALDIFFKDGYDKIQDPAQKEFIDKALRTGQLSPGARTYNLLSEPNAYQKYASNYGAAPVSVNDVINQQDLDKIQSLQQLGGIAPDKYTYTQAGTGGLQTGFDTGKLTADIASAKQGLINSLSKNAAATSHFSSSALPISSQWDADIDATAYANLQNLFKQYETGKITGANQLGASYKGVATPNRDNFLGFHDPVNFTDYGSKWFDDYGGHEVITKTAERATQEAKQQLWKQFLDSLETGGYNKGLGGIAPGSNPELTDTFKVK